MYKWINAIIHYIGPQKVNMHYIRGSLHAFSFSLDQSNLAYCCTCSCVQQSSYTI